MEVGVEKDEHGIEFEDEGHRLRFYGAIKNSLRVPITDEEREALRKWNEANPEKKASV